MKMEVSHLNAAIGAHDLEQLNTLLKECDLSKQSDTILNAILLHAFSQRDALVIERLLQEDIICKSIQPNDAPAMVGSAVDIGDSDVFTRLFQLPIVRHNISDTQINNILSRSKIYSNIPIALCLLQEEAIPKHSDPRYVAFILVQAMKASHIRDFDRDVKRFLWEYFKEYLLNYIFGEKHFPPYIFDILAVLVRAGDDSVFTQFIYLIAKLEPVRNSTFRKKISCLLSNVLNVAVKSGNLAIIECISKKNAILHHVKPDDICTILTNPIKSENTEVVNQLLELLPALKGSPSASLITSVSCQAAQTGNFKIVNLLRAKRVLSRDIHPVYFFNLLISAIRQEEARLINYLLAKPSIRDRLQQQFKFDNLLRDATQADCYYLMIHLYRKKSYGENKLSSTYIDLMKEIIESAGLHSIKRLLSKTHIGKIMHLNECGELILNDKKRDIALNHTNTSDSNNGFFENRSCSTVDNLPADTAAPIASISFK